MSPKELMYIEDALNHETFLMTQCQQAAQALQNPELKQMLLATGDALLAEAEEYDSIWGIGLSMEDERNQHPDAWKGQNLLGFALIQVRQKLAQEKK